MRSMLILFLPFLLSAENIESLYEKVAKSNSYKSEAALSDAAYQQTRTEYLPSGVIFGGGAAFAEVKDNSNSGTEYEVSLVKELSLNVSKLDKLLQQSGRYKNLEIKSLKNRYKVKLWQLYGNYCVVMEALQAKAELSSVYHAIKEHMQKGVKYGEFDNSKVTASSLALESLNLELSKLENLVQTYESQIKVLVDFDGQFECRGLEADLNKLFDPEYSALWPLLESDVHKNKTALKLAQQTFNSVNLEAKYTDELDTSRYTLNFSLPLNIGAKNEAQQAAAMSQLSAANYKLESYRKQYRYESSALQQRLDTYKKYLLSSEKTIISDANLLIKQSNMRFLAGEESFLSMIKATETKLNMIETILDLKLQRHNAVAQYMYQYSIDPQGVKK
ncbi:MAG: TolC family protein [Sulfurimonas sp.]